MKQEISIAAARANEAAPTHAGKKICDSG